MLNLFALVASAMSVNRATAAAEAHENLAAARPTHRPVPIINTGTNSVNAIARHRDHDGARATEDDKSNIP